MKTPSIPAEVEELLARLKGRLEAIHGTNLRGVYLYGSFASGEQSPGSDVDVAVVLRQPGDPWEDIQRCSEAVSELSLRYGLSLSLYRLSEEEWNSVPPCSPLVRNIRRQAVAA